VFDIYIIFNFNIDTGSFSILVKSWLWNCSRRNR